MSVVPGTQNSADPPGHEAGGAPRGWDAGSLRGPFGSPQPVLTPPADLTTSLRTGWDRRYWDSPTATSLASRRCLMGVETNKQTKTDFSIRSAQVQHVIGEFSSVFLFRQ